MSSKSLKMAGKKGSKNGRGTKNSISHKQCGKKPRVSSSCNQLDKPYEVNPYDLEDCDSDDSAAVAAVAAVAAASTSASAAMAGRARHRKQHCTPQEVDYAKIYPHLSPEEAARRKALHQKALASRRRGLPSNPYQLNSEQKQASLLLSASIRHVLLPAFADSINTIFQSDPPLIFDEPGVSILDPVEMIDLRSREAALRLKTLIKTAFDQIYYQLLVVDIEDLIRADLFITVVTDLNGLLGTFRHHPSDLFSDDDEAEEEEEDGGGGGGGTSDREDAGEDSGSENVSCSCSEHENSVAGSADHENKEQGLKKRDADGKKVDEETRGNDYDDDDEAEEEEENEGDDEDDDDEMEEDEEEDEENSDDDEEEEEEEEDADEDEESDGPDYEAIFLEKRLTNRSYRRSRHYKSLPGYESSRKKMLKLRMFTTRQRMEREQRRAQEEREERQKAKDAAAEAKAKAKGEGEGPSKGQAQNHIKEEENQGEKGSDPQEAYSPRSPSPSFPPTPTSSAAPSPTTTPPPFTPECTISIRIRKLVALVVSRAMSAAINPNLERLVWTLRNEHVAQIDPEEILPIDTLLRLYGSEKRVTLHDRTKLRAREKQEARTLYGRRREKFRRAVFDLFFADPTLDPSNPPSLAADSPFVRASTCEDLGLVKVPNASALQRHLMSAMMMAVKSGFMLILDHKMVEEVNSKFGGAFQLEPRRFFEYEFNFTEADLETDDECVTIDERMISPIKETANILALQRTIDMFTAEDIFSRLLKQIFMPLKKQARIDMMKLFNSRESSHGGGRQHRSAKAQGLVNATELIDTRIGLAAVILKRYFLRTVSDMLSVVFQHMAKYVDIMRAEGDKDALSDVPAGTAVETVIPAGNAEFEGLYRVHIEQTLVDYRNVLVAELVGRRQPKTYAELSAIWHTSGLADGSVAGVKETAEQAVKLGEPLPEALSCLRSLLSDMFDIHSGLWTSRETRRTKHTCWRQYMMDMREVTVGERSMVIGFSENLRHQFLGAFNNELRWELIVKGVEIQRYDGDSDYEEDDSEEEEEELSEEEIAKRNARVEAQEKKIVYQEAIDIWTGISAVLPVVQAIFASDTREGNLAAKDALFGGSSNHHQQNPSTSKDSFATQAAPPSKGSGGNSGGKGSGKRGGGKQPMQNNNPTNSTSVSPLASMPPVAPPSIPLNPKLTDPTIIKAIGMIDMRASRAVHLLNAYFDDAIDTIFRQAVGYLNEFVSQVRGAKHKEIKKTIVNCLKNNIPGFSSLYSEMFNRLITAAIASYRNNLVAQLDKPSVGVVQQLVKVFNFGEIDESVIKAPAEVEEVRVGRLKEALDALFVRRCFTSWPAFEMELMAVINGPESMAHTLMKDLIREFFPPFDAELKRQLTLSGVILSKSKTFERLSASTPKANMATLKEAIRLWTSPCVIEQTFARQLTSVIRKTNPKEEAALIDKREPPPPTTARSLAALELIDLRACEAIHRAQARLRSVIAQYHKLLVVYFSLYLEMFYFESPSTKAKYLEMTHNIESISALKRISCYYVEQAICTTRNKLSKAIYGYRGVRKVPGLATDYARHQEMVARAAEFSLTESPETEEAKSRVFRSIIHSLIVLAQDIPVEWQAVDKTGAIHVLNYLLESLLCSIHSSFESRMKKELEVRGIISRKQLHEVLAEMDETTSDEEEEGEAEVEEEEEVSAEQRKKNLKQLAQARRDRLAAEEEAADPDEEDEDEEEVDEEEEYLEEENIEFELSPNGEMEDENDDDDDEDEDEDGGGEESEDLETVRESTGSGSGQTPKVTASTSTGQTGGKKSAPTAASTAASHNGSKKGSNKSSKKKGKHGQKKVKLPI